MFCLLPKEAVQKLENPLIHKPGREQVKKTSHGYQQDRTNFSNSLFNKLNANIRHSVPAYHRKQEFHLLV